MSKPGHIFVCGQCGCQFGRPDPEPVDGLCDDCREKKDMVEATHYINSYLESARHHASMGNRRQFREALKAARMELESLEKHYR